MRYKKRKAVKQRHPAGTAEPVLSETEDEILSLSAVGCLPPARGRRVSRTWRGEGRWNERRLVGPLGFELEPLCGRLSPQAKSRAERRTSSCVWWAR